jgi:16S rRNA processing protein RimM
MSSQSNARQQPEYVVVGRIVRPHGIRGALLVEGISELIQSLSTGAVIYTGSDSLPNTITSFRPHRGMFLLSLEGLSDRDAADQLRGSEIKLLFDQIDLPDHEYYYWQIIGLEVYSENDERLGVIDRIIETGANDVYVVTREAGDQILIPAIEEVVLEVDLDTGRMLVHLLPGLV